MSADRSIESDGKLNSNVYDFFPRHRSNISNINDISIDVLFFISTIDVFFRGIQEIPSHIKYNAEIYVFLKLIHSRRSF